MKTIQKMWFLLTALSPLVLIGPLFLGVNKYPNLTLVLSIIVAINWLVYFICIFIPSHQKTREEEYEKERIRRANEDLEWALRQLD